MHVNYIRVGDEIIELLIGVIFAYRMIIIIIIIIESNNIAEIAFSKFTRNFLVGRTLQSSNLIIHYLSIIECSWCIYISVVYRGR
jgi:hypothetical protein